MKNKIFSMPLIFFFFFEKPGGLQSHPLQPLAYMSYTIVWRLTFRTAETECRNDLLVGGRCVSWRQYLKVLTLLVNGGAATSEQTADWSKTNHNIDVCTTE